MTASAWGLLVLDKPEGITSHRAVERVRRALGAERAGHAGTLDPLATGVLLVGLNRATRLLEFLTGHDKEYVARVRLGERRDTLDRDGQCLEVLPVPSLDPAVVERALGGLRGEIRQVPPIFSALKQAGVPLHRRARRGQVVEEPRPRIVTVRRLALLEICPPDLVIEVECSSGTYVRALARDLGAALGTAACLWELRRTRSGPFGVGQALSLEAVEAAGPAAWSWVLPGENMVAGLPRIEVSDTESDALAKGQSIPDRGVSARAAAFDPAGDVVAIVRPEGGVLRPAKVFRAAPERPAPPEPPEPGTPRP